MTQTVQSFSRRAVLKGAAAAATASFTGLTFGQVFPSKPITIVVGYAPGGSNDVIARMVGQKLGEALGKPVLVDNKPGAGTALAAQLVARSPADGHTLLLADNPFAILSSVMAKPLFRPLEEFQPITLLGTAPQFMFAPAMSKVTAEGLISAAKASPGAVFVANPGAGSLAHLVAEMLQRRAGVTFNHVAYKGSAPALQDTAAGHVQAAFSSFASGKALVEAGKLRLIGVTGEQRLRDFPAVPTFKEMGYADMSVATWWGLVGPAGLPPGVVARLTAELSKIQGMPDIRERYAGLNIDPVIGTAAQYRMMLERDVLNWSRVAKEANIRIE
ncbi:MAG: tripartite tricarboxylate transporter substrate binding protein [Rubrivivax sp.]